MESLGKIDIPAHLKYVQQATPCTTPLPSHSLPMFVTTTHTLPTMKAAAVVSFAILACSVCTVKATAYEVASCADLASIDTSTITALTVTSSAFECSEYTNFHVRNTMTLSATVPAVTFSNFALEVLGELSVDMDVVFSNVYNQVGLL